MNGLYEQTEERCVLLARYMLEEDCTVRVTAAHFGVSKSTVHKDLTEKLPYRNPALYAQIRVLLGKNKAERHLRGGEATRVKYLARRRMIVRRPKTAER